MDNSGFNKQKWRKHGWKVIFIPFVLAAFFAITMVLWNWLMPSIFGLPHITIWQAGGLFILSKILFGFPGGGPKRGGPRGYFLRKRWENMSPEQRLQARQQWGNNACWGDMPAQGDAGQHPTDGPDNTSQNTDRP